MECIISFMHKDLWDTLYMAFIENRKNVKKQFFNPEFYTRYVDDILTIFKEPIHISLIILQLPRRNLCIAFHTQDNQ